MILFNADDFGWTDGHNLAVERAHTQGVLNRASILANGAGFIQAVELSKSLPDLSVGVHLTLNEGKPLLAPQSLGPLVNAQGDFWDTPAALMWLWSRGGLKVNTVLQEWRAQAEHAMQAGLRPSHLDSHKHVHLLPPLLEAILTLAKELGIAYVRLPLENFLASPFRLSAPVLWVFAIRARSRMLRAGISFADRFFGFGTSGKTSTAYLEQAVQQAGEGITEIMVHPAVITPAVQQLMRQYPPLAAYHFELELEALLDLKPRLDLCRESSGV